MLTAGPGSNMLAALVFIGLVLGAYALYFLITARDARGLRRIVLVVLGTGFVVALTSLASTINLFIHLDEFIRWTRTGHVIGSARSYDLKEKLLTEQLVWSDLIKIFVPATKNHYALGSYFVGPAAVILAIAPGGATARSNRIAWAFSLVGGIAIFLVFLAPSFIVLLWVNFSGAQSCEAFECSHHANYARHDRARCFWSRNTYGQR